jgi:hypothetical protein
LSRECRLALKKMSLKQETEREMNNTRLEKNNIMMMDSSGFENHSERS